MVFKGRDIDRALRKKGFQRRETDHHRYFLYVDGRKTRVHTKLSHGTQEYGDTLLGPISRQLHLTRVELNDLIRCPLDAESYVALLRERGILDLDDPDRELESAP